MPLNVVIIAYKYPPKKAMSSMRSYNMAREFARKGCKVSVITSRSRKDEILEHQEPIDVKVLTVRSSDYRSFISKNEDGSQKAYYEKNWKRLFSRILNSFPFNVVIGEGGLLFILEAYSKAKRCIESNDRNLVFTTFRPYADHMVGYLLKIKYPKITWVADFRDPHVDPLYKNTILNSFQHWCNKRVLSKANLISAVSRGIADLFKPYNENCYTLTNGFAPEQLVGSHELPFTKFTIAYTGSMFSDERRPDRLLDAIIRLREEQSNIQDLMQLVYAGPHSAFWTDLVREKGLTSLFRDYGNLSMQDARIIQKKSHINVLLTSSHPEVTGIFTGKLYEYMAAKKPIMVIINGSKDWEYEQLIHELNCGKVFYHQDASDNLYVYLKKQFEYWQLNGHIDIQLQVKSLYKYEWPNIFNRFYEYLLNQKLIIQD